MNYKNTVMGTKNTLILTVAHTIFLNKYNNKHNGNKIIALKLMKKQSEIQT
jgi:hypothetical protein